MHDPTDNGVVFWLLMLEISLVKLSGDLGISGEGIRELVHPWLIKLTYYLICPDDIQEFAPQIMDSFCLSEGKCIYFHKTSGMI